MKSWNALDAQNVLILIPLLLSFPKIGSFTKKDAIDMGFEDKYMFKRMKHKKRQNE